MLIIVITETKTIALLQKFQEFSELFCVVIRLPDGLLQILNLNKLKTVLASSQQSNNEKVKRGIFASSMMCHMLSFLSQKFISNFHVKLRKKVVGI